MSTKFKTLDDAIEAVDGTVSLTITKWDDGFTWVIAVTSSKLTHDGTFEIYDYEWDEADGAHKTATAAGIAACETAIASMAE